VVNFLAQHGDELARFFASKADDKFADVEWEPGLGGMQCQRADSLAYAQPCSACCHGIPGAFSV
jgi:flavin reductase (DIM6/NTAB) family NADH-FMN oxidoreductase RutF